MTRSMIMFFALTLGLISTSLAAAPAAAPPVVFENAAFKYVIAASGQNGAVIDKRTGKNYVMPGQAQPFAILKLGGKSYPATSCALDKTQNLLTLRFEPAAVTVTLKPHLLDTYLAFEVAAVSDPAVEELTLVNLSLASFRERSGISGLATDGEFALVLRALDLQTEGRTAPLLQARLVKQYGFSGARFALLGAPVPAVRQRIQELLQHENIPASPLGGPWALDAPETRGSYIFADVGESNVGDWIALAKKAGIIQIHFIGWERAYGHYVPRADRFPHGVAGMKEAVAKIHAAGLRAGMHTLTGCISPTDAWVSPRPDPRLAADATLTLAGALDATAATVTTREQPGAFDVIWAYSGRGNVLRIDNELIMYSALGSAQPFGFSQCKRGAFGSKPAPHAASARVDHLYVRYGCFQPDADSTLVDDLAGEIAGVFNECGFDMIYMDGAEGMPGGWRGVARMRETLFRKLQGRVLVEASEWGYHSWPFHSRLDAWDYPNWGLKRFTDLHCRSGEVYRRTVLLPSQLGWWAILGPTADHPGEFPDEIEYLCAKSLAFDEPMSFQGIAPGKTPPNARQDEYLEMIGRYERLRLASAVPAAVRERLRQERADFHLTQTADGAWAFLSTDYLAHKVTGQADGSTAWTVDNRHGEQPLQLRLEALYGVAPYDSTSSLVLADFSHKDGFAASAAAAGVKPAFERSSEQVKIGASSGRYQARNSGASPVGAWSRVVKTFAPEVSLKGREALGVWVHGDGKGELLNFQLSNPPQYWTTCDEHYVKVDFTGWRYFELLLRERDADQYADYTWPYGYHSNIYRNPLIKEHTSGLNLYFNNLPPGQTATCYLGPIKALPVRKTTLERPALSLNGQRVEFPVAMPSGSYLEVGRSGAVLYDERGARLQSLTLPAMPRLRPGANQIEFTSATPARAKITLITQGAPFR